MEALTPKKDWSVAIRINHWTMAAVIFVLIGTGFFIANPFSVSSGETSEKFLMGQVRFWHILFGVFLVFLFLWRIYLAFFSAFRAEEDHCFIFKNWRNLRNQIKFYFFLSNVRPQHLCFYGVLQAAAYLTLFAGLLVMSLTGLILLGAGGYHAGWTGLVYGLVKPVENLMGGLAMVRWIHHILVWFIILFVVAHVYMAFWYEAVFQEGTISSMVSGKFFPKPSRG